MIAVCIYMHQSGSLDRQHGRADSGGGHTNAGAHKGAVHVFIGHRHYPNMHVDASDQSRSMLLQVRMLLVATGTLADFTHCPTPAPSASSTASTGTYLNGTMP